MTSKKTNEIAFQALSGWTLIGLEILLLAASIYCFIQIDPKDPIMVLPACLLLTAFSVLLPGFFIVNPNESRVLVLFGKYRGSVREQGFFWTNPFTIKHQLSSRRTMSRARRSK